MAKRERTSTTPDPNDEESGVHHFSGNNAATPYSSGAEGVLPNFSPSHGAPYGSFNPLWHFEQGIPPQVDLGQDLHPTMSYYPFHPFPGTYSTPRGNLPIARDRELTPQQPPSSSRQTTSSPASAKGRKTKAAKTAKVTEVVIEQPLSILTKDLKIPLKDMEKFVKRSTEERMQEREKKNGHIVRPMNAFMLYRSAYTDRAKGLFAQNNHQIVSKATGQSWRIETKEIQEYYKSLSEIERDNHQKAWPDYKFSPSKNGTPSRKRKEPELNTDDEDAVTEQDLSDYDWTPQGSKKPKTLRTTHRNEVLAQNFGHPFLDQLGYAIPGNHASYPYINPGHAMPISGEGINRFSPEISQYPGDIQPHLHRQLSTGDSHFERSLTHPDLVVNVPSGLPGTNHYNLFDMNHITDQGQNDYGHVDPKLESYSLSHQSGPFTEQGFHDYHEDSAIQYVSMAGKLEGDDSDYPQLHTGNSEGFQKWVENQNESRL